MDNKHHQRQNAVFNLSRFRTAEDARTLKQRQMEPVTGFYATTSIESGSEKAGRY